MASRRFPVFESCKKTLRAETSLYQTLNPVNHISKTQGEVSEVEAYDFEVEAFAPKRKLYGKILF
jgi:hypothetical protein